MHNMKIHQTKGMKVLVILVLSVCAGLYWYNEEYGEIPFQYIWPMHLVVVVIGFIMIFGMMADQKAIDAQIHDYFGSVGLINRVRNQLISGLCMIPVFLVTMLPAFFLMGPAIDAGFKEDKGEVAFIAIWLLFAIASFMYFLVTQPIMTYVLKIIANKVLQRISH